MKITIEEGRIVASVSMGDANVDEAVEAFKSAMIAVGYSMDRFFYVTDHPTLEDRIKHHNFANGPFSLALELCRDLVIIPREDLK